LTPNLGVSTIPNFTVTASAPATARRGQQNILATIDGTLLDSGGPCPPVAHWVHETPGDKELTQLVIPLTIGPYGSSQITGHFDVPPNAPLGAYDLKVFIGDKVQTLANALIINPAG
jgi:hypothetical protein